jgi:Tetratricopeptide repeat
LRELGEVGRARELHEQALAMYQRLYEGDHPFIATCLNQLAFDLRELGEVGRARELDDQALAMRWRLREQRASG